MKSALVAAAGNTPIYADHAAPVAHAGELLITVAAAALYPLVRARAAGHHYSAAGLYPLIPGVDGVGRTPSGDRVYFSLPRDPFGAMAEQTVVAADRCTPVPAGLDNAMAAALANPGMSSMAALKDRAQFQPGEAVLINGATGASGQLAVQIARALGAGRIVATGRNRAVLEHLTTLGADETIALDADPQTMATRFEALFAGGVDVVLDYLWGPSALTLLRAAARAARPGKPIRFVQIGTASGLEISLPGAILRSSGLVLMGSGLGSVSNARLLERIGEVLQLAATGGLQLPIRAVPLADVAAMWSDTAGPRTVFMI
ncbi:zinc-binding alcohol dehydrogenase family protein [Novosphingobium sp.]|uniref:quinone oxidoreductase family protein n=1 Tax=Novosphingobium sp. TaxID=1874826 RepID=UPI00333EC33F